MKSENSSETGNSELQLPGEQGLGFLHKHSDCVLVVARDYRVLSINEAGLVQFGLHKEEALERYFYDAMHLNHTPCDSELHTCPLKKVFETGELVIAEQTFHPNGSELIIDIQAFPLEDKQGEIDRMVIFLRDVTIQRQSLNLERVAQQAKDGTITEIDMLRLLLDNINLALWITDWDNQQVLYVSTAYEAIWGYSCDSLYVEGWSWSANIHPEDRARIVDSYSTNAILGTYDEVYRIIDHEGQVRWIHDRAFPIPDEEGNVWMVAGISEDVTDIKDDIQNNLNK